MKDNKPMNAEERIWKDWVQTSLAHIQNPKEFTEVVWREHKARMDEAVQHTLTHLLEQVEELKGGKMYKSEYPYRCAIEAIDIRIRSLMEGEKYLTQKGEQK